MPMTKYVPTEPKGSFMDYTYCASPKCENKCGRKISDAISKAIDAMPYARIAFAYFCGE